MFGHRTRRPNKKYHQMVLTYYVDPEDETECRTDRTFDMSIAANQEFIKCLTTDTGKQVLCEMLSVIESVKGDTLRAEVYFPSVTDKNGNRHSQDAENEEENNDTKEESSPYFIF